MGAVGQLALPDHFMRRFFLASLCVDMHHNAEALQHLQVRTGVGCGGDGEMGRLCPFCLPTGIIP
jgi:hypothetical protein